MKRRLFAIIAFAILACIPVLWECSDNNTDNNPTICQDEMKPVEQVGQVPDDFKGIVENNSFNGVTAFAGRLLKVERYSADEENRTVIQRVRMMDLYGNDLATFTCSSDDAYHITTLTATADGGFLFVLGFEDYAYNQNAWASDKGVASRIIKCDEDGMLQFDTPLGGVDGAALRWCFEKNGKFYLFGALQTPETKTQGVYSPTDIYMVVLNENGTVLKTQRIGGSDFDSLDAVECLESGFVLSVSSQSDDGDFAGSGSNGYPISWGITVDEDLKIIEKKKEAGRDGFDYRIGEIDGTPVYRSDARLSGFDAGTVEAFIDYGDFYLIVSENNTGIYEKDAPAVSSIWYYTETVYSAYDYEGELIFRAAVDSSPDYDAVFEKFVTENDSAP